MEDTLPELPEPKEIEVGEGYVHIDMYPVALTVMDMRPYAEEMYFVEYYWHDIPDYDGEILGWWALWDTIFPTDELVEPQKQTGGERKEG